MGKSIQQEAEEYELPDLDEGSSSKPYDLELEDLSEGEGLLGGKNGDRSEEDEVDWENREEDREIVGKGTKIELLIARVGHHLPACCTLWNECY